MAALQIGVAQTLKFLVPLVLTQVKLDKAAQWEWHEVKLHYFDNDVMS